MAKKPVPYAAYEKRGEMIKLLEADVDRLSAENSRLREEREHIRKNTEDAMREQMRVHTVVQRREEADYVMPVIDVHPTSNGLHIIVGDSGRQEP